jgi:hypothetical protein
MQTIIKRTLRISGVCIRNILNHLPSVRLHEVAAARGGGPVTGPAQLRGVAVVDPRSPPGQISFGGEMVTKETGGVCKYSYITLY